MTSFTHRDAPPLPSSARHPILPSRQITIFLSADQSVVGCFHPEELFPTTRHAFERRPLTPLSRAARPVHGLGFQRSSPSTTWGCAYQSDRSILGPPDCKRDPCGQMCVGHGTSERARHVQQAAVDSQTSQVNFTPRVILTDPRPNCRSVQRRYYCVNYCYAQ